MIIIYRFIGTNPGVIIGVAPSEMKDEVSIACAERNATAKECGFDIRFKYDNEWGTIYKLGEKINL